MIKNTMTPIKVILAGLVAWACFIGAATAQDKPTTEGDVTFTAKGVLPPPPLFFTAEVASKTIVSATMVIQDIPLTLKILQGTPELLTLG